MRRLLPLILAVACAAARADAFDAMHERWQAKLTGPAAMDRSTPAVQLQLAAISKAAQQALARMRPEGSGPLWDDLADFNNPKGLLASAAVTSNVNRLEQMALAWATPGGVLYHDAALAQAVQRGLDWWLREHYHTGLHAYGNWWDWQIGAPQHLLNAVSLMDGQLPPALKRRALDAANWYVPDPRYKTRNDGSLDRCHSETGANLLDKALVAILSGMLDHDGGRIALGRDAISPALEYVNSGDGYYRDNSFIQHTYIAYTGSYGVVALSDFARLACLLNGSDWPVTDPHFSRVYLWAREAYAAVIVNGAMPDALRGRKLSAQKLGDHMIGRGTIGALAALAETAPPADRSALRAAIKGWMARDRSFGEAYLAKEGGPGIGGLPLYEVGLLQGIAADAALAAAPEAPGVRLYASMDRALLRGPGFAAMLSMTSPRTSSFEFGNGENLKAWWTGMGMLTLYDGDPDQFGHDFWPTVDSLRLPGTTTDHSGSGRPTEWKQYANPQAWVGGAALGSVAALGMEFSLRQVTGSPLHGRKSWFLLGDRIVALGSGIGGAATETIVENRRLTDAQGALLLVDGAALANGRREGAHWAWLQDAQAGASTGYLFPQGAEVVAERAERSGSWRDLNEQGSSTLFRNTFQSLAIGQGKSDYAYVLLPVASEARVRAEAADPGLRIEANDAQAAAVSDLRGHAYAANLWQAGSAPRGGQPYVSSSAPAALVLQESAGQLVLAVADPSQQVDDIELTVARPAGALLSASAGVTVLETAPRLRLRIHSAGAAGASFEARFRSDLP